jgi:hypothetical protein
MKIQEKIMPPFFVWTLPQHPPRTPAEEDAYYAQFELWPGHAAMAAMRRRVQRLFADRHASGCDRCSSEILSLQAK